MMMHHTPAHFPATSLKIQPLRLFPFPHRLLCEIQILQSNIQVSIIFPWFKKNFSHAILFI
jgi:hypothetical protein